MSHKIKTKPEIRFSGYTDDWKRRKLGEVSDVTKLAGFEFTKYVIYADEGKIIALRGLNVKNGNLVLDDVKYIDQSDFSKLNRSKLFKDDILFTYVGTVGELAVVPENDKYYLAPNVARIRLNDSVDPQFVSQMMGNRMFYNRVIFPLIATSSQPALSMENVRKFVLKLPSIEEQAKIGTFFKELDNLITLHQRQLEALEKTKKSFLQKMFPKKDETKPEIRFAGFTDDWEQRKLKDYSEYRRGSFPQPYGNKDWYDGEGAMPFVQVVDVDDNLRLVDDTKQKISKLAQPKSIFVPTGKVVVTLQGSIGRVAITQYDCYLDRTILIFENYKEKTDEYFWAYTIQRKFEIEKERAPGGTIKTITKEALSSFEIFITSYPEQKKIGTFFKQLDDNIALHQRQLEALEKTKKSFLQKMFV